RCAILGACSLILTQGLMAQTSTPGGSTGGPAPSPTPTPTASTSGSTSGGPANTGRQVSLHVPDESAPLGGTVQMKFLVTEPTPISTGGPRVPRPAGTTPVGIQLFNPTGDVNGVAMVGATEITIASISSSGAQGSDYPIMTVAFQLPTNVSIGTKLPFSLDPASPWTLGLLGTATVKPFPPATITVGISSISITDVIPGGGVLPAGTVVSIEGMGFQSKTQVQLSGFQASAITVVSPQE